MRKVIVRSFAMLLVICLLAGCGLQPEQYVQMGDESREAGEYEKALDYYRQAGELGKEKRKDLLVARSRARNRNHDAYDKSLAYLMENGSDVFTEEEAMENLVEYLDQYLEACLEEVRQAKDSEEPPEFVRVRDLREKADSAKSVIKEGTPGLQEALDKAYELEGWLYLISDAPEYIDAYWYDVLSAWSNCTSGTGAEVTQAVETLWAGNTSAAAEELKRILETPRIVRDLWRYQGENMQFETINRALEYEGVYRTMYPQGEQTTLVERFENISDLRRGSNSESSNIRLNESMIADLKANCGKNAEDKVLILHVTGSGVYVDLDIGLMSLLPDQYYPTSIESVRYAIVLAGDSVETGRTYDKGTKQVREDVTLRLYDVTTGKELNSIVAEGPESMFITYSGEPPKYYSAGKAYIGEELTELCKTIEK